MTDAQFRILIRAIFVAGWLADGRNSPADSLKYGQSTADLFMTEQKLGDKSNES